MKPYYEDEFITLYNADCLSVLPLQVFDVLITDPPYPNFHQDAYRYADGVIDFCKTIPCLQLIFWSIKAKFPLDYTCCHIWNKLCGTYATKEAIYERNGNFAKQEFRYQKIKNIIDARMNRDIITGHPSQKPIRLMMDIVARFTKINNIILDTFAGTGSTLVACKRHNRKAIGIEIEEKYCRIIVERLSQCELGLGTLDNMKVSETAANSPMLFATHIPEAGTSACGERWCKCQR